MIDESLRDRLEALNRGPLPKQAAAATEQPKNAVPAPHLPRPAAKPSRQRPATPELIAMPGKGGHSVKPTAGLVRSGDEVETAYGPHLRIRVPIEGFWPNGSQLVAARQQFLQSQLVAAQQAIEPTVAIESEFATLIGSLPDRAVGLDLETCGLAGSALFLVGLIHQIDGRPTVELLLARNYSEEAAVLATLWETIARHEVLLTFNGKSFDWPMVVERSVRHRIPVAWSLPGSPWAAKSAGGATPQPARIHIDILHHARRRWRSQLPNCRLQTLEQHVCRRTRVDDIPGHRIPAVYADYVRTGFEREMDMVLHHNAHDLVTLLDLALRLAL